jgi:hypothetical protein
MSFLCFPLLEKLRSRVLFVRIAFSCAKYGARIRPLLCACEGEIVSPAKFLHSRSSALSARKLGHNQKQNVKRVNSERDEIENFVELGKGTDDGDGEETQKQGFRVWKPRILAPSSKPAERKGGREAGERRRNRSQTSTEDAKGGIWGEMGGAKASSA